MSNYKNFLLRQLGIKESQFPESNVDKNMFPGIDPEEKESEPTNRDRMISPTAIATPVIGVAVRGSVTGGLPSGKEMSPSKLGGYTPIKNPKPNSEIINNTPKNSAINSSNPISNDTKTVETPEPRQVQNFAGEPPQAVTGADEEGDTSLSLKSAAPDDVTGTGDEAVDDVNAVEVDGKEPVEKCQCGADKGECQCDQKTEAESETEGANEPLVNNQAEKHFKKVSDRRLEEVKKSLQEKAISGKLNKQETEIFSRIKEVIEKRSLSENKESKDIKSIQKLANIKSK